MKIKDKEFVTYLPSEKIQKRIKELASQIERDYNGRTPVFVAVLNGSFMFAADLFKNLENPAEISFIKVASYEKMSSTGNVKNLIGLNQPLYQRDVIILEDIIDSGLTMERILNLIGELEPNSIEIVSLLYKPEALKVELDIRYTGFEIPNKFVVGYGLDYDGLGRNFKDIWQLKS